MQSAAISGVDEARAPRAAPRAGCRRAPARGSAGSAGRRGAATSSSLDAPAARRSPWNTASAAFWLMSTAEAGESETCAAASAGASFRPSPTISTRRPARGELLQARGSCPPACSRRASRAMPSARRDRGDDRRAVAGQQLEREAAAPAAPRPPRPRRRAAGRRRRSAPAHGPGARQPQLGAARPRRRRRCRRRRGCRAAPRRPARRSAGPQPGTSSTPVGGRRRPARRGASARASGWRLAPASAAATAQRVRLDAAGPVERRPAEGQRAGLVEDHGVDLRRAARARSPT